MMTNKTCVLLVAFMLVSINVGYGQQPTKVRRIGWLGTRPASGPSSASEVIRRELHALGWVEGVPICLPLSILVCAAVIAIYRFALGWQGRLLQGREQTILETVTTKAE